MKKLTILLVMIMMISLSYSQTEKNTFAINVSDISKPYLFKDKDISEWNVGLNFMQFAENKLAFIAGINYGQINSNSVLSLNMGAKYYLFNFIPIGADLNGSMGRSHFGDFFPIHVRFNTGISIFISNRISIEPTIQYNLSLTEYYKDFLEGLIGFTVYF